MEILKMRKATDRTFRLIHLAYVILIICITFYIIVENLNDSRTVILISIHVLAFVIVASLRHSAFKNNKIIKVISLPNFRQTASGLYFLRRKTICCFSRTAN